MFIIAAHYACFIQNTFHHALYQVTITVPALIMFGLNKYDQIIKALAPCLYTISAAQ